MGYTQNPMPIHLLVPFTVRTKEPADVFPRRARPSPPRDIPDFASAPVGVTRRTWIQNLHEGMGCKPTGIGPIQFAMILVST